MPLALALLPAEQGAQPLLVALAGGVAMGVAAAALRQFAALAPAPGRRWASAAAEELCLPGGAVVHHRALPGGAVVAVVLCEPGENAYEGKEALADLELVAVALSKGGEVTEAVLTRRYGDAYLAIEGLALGDVCARDRLLAGLASQKDMHHVTRDIRLAKLPEACRIMRHSAALQAQKEAAAIFGGKRLRAPAGAEAQGTVAELRAAFAAEAVREGWGLREILPAPPTRPSRGGGRGRV